MTQAKGTVTALDGDYALVRTEDGGCGRCHEEGGCQGANIGRMFCGTEKSWRVLNPRGAKVGEQVSVAVADGAVNAGATLIYVWPLLFFVGGAMLGSVLSGEPGAIAGGAAGLALAWYFVRRAVQRRRQDARFQPYIV